MKVLIAGGTGFIGTALAIELTACGHDVTALSRSPDESALPDEVSSVAVDVTDRDRVIATVQGYDAIVNLVALSPLFQPDGGDEIHDVVHLGGTENLVEAAEIADIDRFVQMSALGADPDGPTYYIRSKGEAETVVRESVLDWTIVRPSVVFGDGGEFVSFTRTLTTPYVTGLPGGGSSRFQPIWVDDLVPMLADCLADRKHVDETYELGGPAVLTLADVAKATYAAGGKSLVVLPVPMPLAKVGLAVADVVPLIPMGSDQYRSLQFDNTVADNDVTEFGLGSDDLTTLGAYLAADSGSDTPPATSTDAVSPGATTGE